MIKRRTSLVFKLTASLILFQVLAVVALLAVAAYNFGSKPMGFVDDDVARRITDNIALDAQGKLALSADARARTLGRYPSVWFVASDESGRQLRMGPVPALYEGLAAVLPSLEPSDIRASRDSQTLSSRVTLRDTSFGRLHVLMGGITVTGPWVIFAGMMRMFGVQQMLPLALVTLCVIPLLTYRTLRGVARAAKQAEAINIRQRDARLSEDGLPAEIYPLVRAVNEALCRMSEGYDARDRFLAGAAHELRAPIAILDARIALLVTGSARTRLAADVARLANLAEALLDLQRLGRRLTDMQPVDLDALAHQVTSDMAPLVLGAGYEIEFNGGHGPVRAAGDALSLSRALINLVQNAIAHGGGRGTISIDVGADGTLSVRDQGPGVASAERERIFEPFYRIRPSDQGTGLGLHLVREIVDLHHGTVAVTEVAGGGACFQLRLPVLAA